MTIPPVFFWVVAVGTVLAAFAPVTRDGLNRFTELTGLSVTPANAPQVIDHFTRLRRWRLIALVPAVPVAVLTDDLFYLVLGWCTPAILAQVGKPASHPQIHRTVWRLSLAAAIAAGAYLLPTHGITPAVQIHTLVLILVTAAVHHLTRSPDPTPVDNAERAVNHWSTRSLYLAGTATVLSAALLTPGHPPDRELPEYTMPQSFPQQRAAFTTADEYEPPTCAFNVVLDAPCRSWLLDGEPFPQAAPYLLIPGKTPRRAPFQRSPNREAVVYLDRHDRRMTYQDADQIQPLTGSLADTEMPKVTFARQNRYVALTRDGTQIFDTRTWAELELPGIRKVHDLNESGIVATTPSKVLVLDHRGRERMSLPIRKYAKNVIPDTYHLRPDGRRLVIVRNASHVETFDTATGRRLSRVTPVFPDHAYLDAVVRWTKQGRLLVRDTGDTVYTLDPATGALRER